MNIFKLNSTYPGIKKSVNPGIHPMTRYKNVTPHYKLKNIELTSVHKLRK